MTNAETEDMQWHRQLACLAAVFLTLGGFYGGMAPGVQLAKGMPEEWELPTYWSCRLLGLALGLTAGAGLVATAHKMSSRTALRGLLGLAALLGTSVVFRACN